MKGVKMPLYLRIIIFIGLCVMGVLIAGLINSFKKANPELYSEKSVIECPKGICPPPKEGWLIRWRYWKEKNK